VTNVEGESVGLLMEQNRVGEIGTIVQADDRYGEERPGIRLDRIEDDGIMPGALGVVA
jgi:hypothetical protein